MSTRTAVDAKFDDLRNFSAHGVFCTVLKI